MTARRDSNLFPFLPFSGAPALPFRPTNLSGPVRAHLCGGRTIARRSHARIAIPVNGIRDLFVATELPLLFAPNSGGAHVTWTLQRDNDVLTCEIRQAADSSDYEFAVASTGGRADTVRFRSATELIDGYLRWQSALRGHGWRPRIATPEAA